MISLTRLSMTRFGTFGILLEDGVPFALTLEPQWCLNMPSISCIPPDPGGVLYYVCSRITSPKFGDTFEITNVPSRSEVLFHWGNRDEDTKGCILVGEEFGLISDDAALLSSRRGFEELLFKTRGLDSFPLRISWYCGN